jgi:DNA-binding response OmpR family regulator
MTGVVAKARILIVEDEQDVASLIKHAVERSGEAQAEVVAQGDRAVQLVLEDRPDLVILDLNLPEVDGMHVCRLLRARPETRAIPIMMVTARASEADRVAGLDVGADDYLIKPFSLRELAARVRALLRRTANDGERRVPAYRSDLLSVDFDAVTVSVEGRVVRLTRREFELLRYLVQNKNRVVSRDRLLERVWGYDRIVETRSVDVHVGRLRTKLGPAGRQLETVIGLGYRFVD